MNKKLRKSRKLYFLVVASLIILGIIVSVGYATMRLNSEKELQYQYALQKYADFSYNNYNTGFKENFYLNLTFYADTNKEIRVKVDEFTETENYIAVDFADSKNQVESGYVEFESFRKSMTEEQYNSIVNYLNCKPDLGDKYYYELVCSSYYLYNNQFFPKTVEIVITQKDHVWYAQDEVAERYVLNPDVPNFCELFQCAQMHRNPIDEDFVFGNYSHTELMKKIGTVIDGVNLYRIDNFEYAYYEEDFVYVPKDLELYSSYGTASYDGDFNIYTVTYIDTFNLLDNCRNDIIYVSAFVITLFLLVGIVLSLIIWIYLKKQLEQERNLITITNSLAHNLKTPLFIISGNAENLTELAISDEEKACTEAIGRQVKLMDERVRNMFELSRMETTVYKLNYEQFNMTKLVLEVIENYVDCNKHLVFENNTEVIVNADKSMIGTVVETLIDNAIKYSTDDSVTISLTEKTFAVSNRCKGIVKKDLKNFWKPYYRHPANGQKTGNGIGLTMVKKILKLHKFKSRMQLQDNIITILFNMK